MNAAKARRRWQAWRRYLNRHMGEGIAATPAAWQAYNEWATHLSIRNWLPGAKRYYRINRRTRKGARR